MLHALQLRRIVDQLMFRASRIFKPWVKECLEHWYKEKTNKYELSYPIRSARLMYGTLISSSRKDKSTQTLGDDQITPKFWGGSQWLKNGFGRYHSFELDTANLIKGPGQSQNESNLSASDIRSRRRARRRSKQSRPPSLSGTDRRKSSTSGFQSRFRARSQLATISSHRFVFICIERGKSRIKSRSYHADPTKQQSIDLRG